MKDVNRPSASSSAQLQLCDVPGRGRSLLSTGAIKAGEILLKDSPLLLYPNYNNQSSSSSSFCSHCFRTLHPQQNPPLSCPSCVTQFCSSSCQSSASHSLWTCSALNFLNSIASSVNPDLRTQVAFLIAAYNLSIVSPGDFAMILSLQGDSEEVSLEEVGILYPVVQWIVERFPLPSGAAAVTPEMIALLLAKDKKNGFGLMEKVGEGGERAVRAYAVFRMASFFNHDCLPNACRFEYIDNPGDGNTDMVVRALHDIPAGREVCLSYFPVNWNYAERQKRLLEDYGFVCECDRCKVEKNWKEEEDCMEADDDEEDIIDRPDDGEPCDEDEQDFPHAYFFLRYLCDRENCGGTMAPLPPTDGTPSDIMECNVCGQLRTEELDDNVMDDDE